MRQIIEYTHAIVFELVGWVGGFYTNKIKFNIDLIQFAGISVFVLVGEIQAATTGLIDNMDMWF